MLVPDNMPERVSCDGIELNRVRDEHGRRQLEQWILWDDQGYVSEWRYYHQEPIRRQGDGWVLLLFDTHRTKRLWEIHSRWHHETWTDYDREVEDRGRLPELNRIRLLK